MFGNDGMGDKTLAKNRSIIYRKFLHIIRNCKQVICADADLNDISINWMKTHKPNVKYIVNEYQHNKNVLAYEMKSFTHMIDKLKTEEKFLLCTDSKSNAELIYKQLNDEKICLITAPICGGVLEQYGQLKKNEEAK